MSILGHSEVKIKLIPLVDKSSTGKVRPWVKNKKNSVLLSESYKRLGKDKRAERVRVCANWQLFNICENHHKFLKKAHFCGLRLCPMCAWRRTYKNGFQIRKVAHHATMEMKSVKLRWIFLTLTCKNVEGYELPDQLDVLAKSWKRMTETKAFKDSVLGYFRATEVSRSAEYLITGDMYEKGKNYYDGLMLEVGDINPNFNTYHPHFHVIMAVPSSYFKSKKYRKTEEWVQMWRKAMKADYDPVVHVETVKMKRDKAMEEKILYEKGLRIEAEVLPNEAVAELAKYVTKAADFIIPGNIVDTDEAVTILDASLKGRKLFAYGGILKDVYDFLRKNGDVDDIENEKTDLIHMDGKDDKNCTCPTCQSAFMEAYYKWLPDKKGYYLFPH
ncbi:protein rep [Paenibacillus agricola]|uniref:Protein rep n=1 Tax=Paenibacillus agricola TaxID=2716264 RepID=A0ABX0JGE6_9BACL|nr:protein rep [Paenibacillus agricola]NHN35549.1 protein rep [Paenibacillus agricola]